MKSLGMHADTSGGVESCARKAAKEPQGSGRGEWLDSGWSEARMVDQGECNSVGKARADVENDCRTRTHSAKATSGARAPGKPGCSPSMSADRRPHRDGERRPRRKAPARAGTRTDTLAAHGAEQAGAGARRHCDAAA